jgi:predicted phosphodiesterase
MKIAISSDIHANAATRKAFREPYDEMWVMADLVNFGPDTAEVVDWVRKHAVGYNADPRRTQAYQAMAAETGCYSASVLAGEPTEYLRLFPLKVDLTVAGTRLHLCDETSSDPLFGYLEENAWTAEVISMHAGILPVGHTHEPVLRQLGNVRLVNPGSLTGLRVTDPQASYALWEDGELHLKRYSHWFEETISAIESLPASQAIQQPLSQLTTTGDLMVAGE